MPAAIHDAAGGSAVEVSGLSVRYGNVTAVEAVDLTARRGEVLALLGRNGAGKTSTVETLEGYRRRSAGNVRVLGLDPGIPREARCLAGYIGVMLQRGGVYPGMGPGEAVRLFASYYDNPERPGHLLERLGLASVTKTPWRRLSGGEQQRVSLAIALVGRPQVAFLDEPTAGVDPQGRVAIRSEIRRMRDEGACVLLTTHELGEAERLADRIVIIEHGRVVAAGTLSELTGGGDTGVRFDAQPGIDTASLAGAIGRRVSERSPGEYVVEGDSSPVVTASLAAWMAERDLTLTGLRTGDETLEEVFLRLTGAPPGEPGV